MTLLDLACEVGLNPYKASSTQGGEYKSSCPVCGGKDRFFIQPNKQMKNCAGYYRCRQCDTAGDAIQFAIDFNGMDFKDAAQLVNAILPERNIFFKLPTQPTFKPVKISRSSDLWKTKANAFVAWAHKNIWPHKAILTMLHKRGISADAIRAYKIGWNPLDITREKSDWDIEIQNNNKQLWLPAGIVIPSLESNGDVHRLKIRRIAWKPTDTIGKYIAVSGSAKGLTIVGDTEKDLMIVIESELDTYATHHAVSDFAFVVAIGSNIKNPDNITDFLAKKKALLICPDNDNGGEAMWKKWKKLYPDAYSYPAPLGKDIGESIEKGLRIRPWILQYKWDKTIDQELVDYALTYIDDRTVTRASYTKLEKEIFTGPYSPRAKTGTLQKGLTLMRQLITNYHQ